MGVRNRTGHPWSVRMRSSLRCRRKQTGVYAVETIQEPVQTAVSTSTTSQGSQSNSSCDGSILEVRCTSQLVPGSCAEWEQSGGRPTPGRHRTPVPQDCLAACGSPVRVPGMTPDDWGWAYRRRWPSPSMVVSRRNRGQLPITRRDIFPRLEPT